MKNLAFAIVVSFLLSACAGQATKSHDTNKTSGAQYNNDQFGVQIDYDPSWTMLYGDRDRRSYSERFDNKDMDGIAISFFLRKLNNEQFDYNPSVTFNVENVNTFKTSINSGVDFLRLLDFHLKQGKFANLEYDVGDIVRMRIGGTEYYALHSSVGIQGYLTQRICLARKINSDYIASMVLTFRTDAEMRAALQLAAGVQLPTDASLQAHNTANSDEQPSL